MQMIISRILPYGLASLHMMYPVFNADFKVERGIIRLALTKVRRLFRLAARISPWRTTARRFGLGLSSIDR